MAQLEQWVSWLSGRGGGSSKWATVVRDSNCEMMRLRTWEKEYGARGARDLGEVRVLDRAVVKRGVGDGEGCVETCFYRNSGNSQKRRS